MAGFIFSDFDKPGNDAGAESGNFDEWDGSDINRNGIVKMLRSDFGQIAPFFIVNLISQCDNFPITKIY